MGLLLSACSGKDPLPAQSSPVDEQDGILYRYDGDGMTPVFPFDRYLVAWYSCNEGSGTIVGDATPKSYDGLIEGGAKWNVGVEGTSLMFDGSGLARFTQRDMLNAVGTLRYGTISLWFYYEGILPGSEMVPLLYFGGNESRSSHNLLILEIGHPENEFLYFTILRDNVLLQCFDSDIPIARNRWQHVAVVVSSKGNTGYLNGVELTGRHYNAGSPASTEFFASVPVRDMTSLAYGTTAIARGFRFFDGKLDDVRLYNRMLSGDEIRTIYNSVRSN
jgi:hypothetical protein